MRYREKGTIIFHLLLIVSFFLFLVRGDGAKAFSCLEMRQKQIANFTNKVLKPSKKSYKIVRRRKLSGDFTLKPEENRLR
jgi:hypothetical protein